MKMTIRLILIATLFPMAGIAQYFSGEITYEMTIIPKSDTVNLEEILHQKHGTTASYIIASKQYKSSYYKEDSYRYSYTYDDRSKRMFDDYSDKPYITFRDSQRANNTYYNSQIFKDSTLNILGHSCYLVITEADYGTSKTYYSDDIRVNYEDFEGHQVGNWYEKLKEVNGAIMLKSVTEHDLYYEIQEATHIEERPVNPEEFELPEKPIAASYTALDEQVQLEKPSQDQIRCYQVKVNTVSKEGGEKITSYVSFMLTETGELKYFEALEKDPEDLYKVALDIAENCGFQFIPGKINGEAVNSQVYMPVDFFR